MMRYRLTETECELLIMKYEAAEESRWNPVRGRANFFKWCNTQLADRLYAKVYGTCYGKNGNGKPRLYMRVQDDLELMHIKLTWLSN